LSFECKKLDKDSLSFYDIRLLEYLARISVKHEIDSANFLVVFPYPSAFLQKPVLSKSLRIGYRLDETGTIQLPLWNKQIDEISVGGLIQVENANIIIFRGVRQLKVGRSGKVSVVKNS